MRFKNKKDEEMFHYLHPALLMIFFDLDWYAQTKHGIDLVVTQTVTTEEIDKKLNRVSDAHRTCRAIDIRTRNLDASVVNDIVDYINNKQIYDQYKYLSRNGRKRLAYSHNGSAQHLHLAIHKRYSKREIKIPVL